MYRITHPRPQAGRQKALGVEFVDGFAEVVELHPERRLALIQHGYSIEEVAAVRQAKRSGKGKPAKAGKASEPKGGALSEPPLTVADMEAVAEVGFSLPPGRHSLEDVAAELGVSLDEV